VISSFLLVSRLVQVIPSPYVSGSTHKLAQPYWTMEENKKSLIDEKDKCFRVLNPDCEKAKR